jgi:multidrug resistance efflux pump
MLECLESPDRDKHVERWRRQIATPYAELSEREQESDRVEARKVLERLSSLSSGPLESTDEIHAKTEYAERMWAAYKRAKEENDERFCRERDEARQERDALKEAGRSVADRRREYIQTRCDGSDPCSCDLALSKMMEAEALLAKLLEE